MSASRRQWIRLAGLVLVTSGLSAPAIAHEHEGLRSGKLFTISNAADGNEVLVFGRSEEGRLQLMHHVPTGGHGTGAGLGSQGAVTLSGDGRYLFVVNAMSNSVSTFAVREWDLQLKSVVASGGLQPISVTEHHGVVYVLNAGGDGNIAGFRNAGGQLKAIDDGVRALSAAGGTAPAQVGFDRNGQALVVAERATNKLTTYRVQDHGQAGAPKVNDSAGMTPFGFAFNKRNVLVVSEAFGGAADASALSSYRFETGAPGRPMVVSASVPTTQTAACWVAITPSGRYAYTTNTGSGSVSSYRIGWAGHLKLLDAVAANTGTGSGPIDAAIPPTGRRLDVLSGATGTIKSYRIGSAGQLVPAGTIGGLPAGTSGLASN
jgi:6-phosphogluconolactonase